MNPAKKDLEAKRNNNAQFRHVRKTNTNEDKERQSHSQSISKKKDLCRKPGSSKCNNEEEDWLSIESTQEIKHIPERLIDQIIAQDEAKEIIEIAAKQRRNVLLIGPPGTGKSMLGRAYAELITQKEKHDLLAYPNLEDPFKPRIVSVPKGRGEETIVRLREMNSTLLKKVIHYRNDILFIALAIVIIVQKGLDLYLLGIYALLWVMTKAFFPSKRSSNEGNMMPWLILDAQSTPDFIDATGLKAGGLFGDVLHDPYQSGGLETPPHKRLILGAVQKAHNGVLYIDEAGNLDLETQIELLSVLQDRKCPIRGRTKESTASAIYTDAIPADFSLVIAGNIETIELLHPALRSRLIGYGYEVLMKTAIPDTKENRKKLVQFIAQEVRKDGRIPHFSREAVLEVVQVARVIAEKPSFLTLELRKLAGIIRAAGDLARTRGEPLVQAHHVLMAYKLTLPVDEQIRAQKWGFFHPDREHDVFFPISAYLCNYGLVRTIIYEQQSDSNEWRGFRIEFSSEVSPKFRAQLFSYLSRLSENLRVTEHRHYFIQFPPHIDKQIDEVTLLATLVSILKAKKIINPKMGESILVLSMIDADGKITNQFTLSEIRKAIECFSGKIIVSDEVSYDHERLIKISSIDELIIPTE